MPRATKIAVPAGRVLVEKHFAPVPVESLVTAGRTFPRTLRVDLQRALEQQFREVYPAIVRGIHAQLQREEIGLADLVTERNWPVVFGPVVHEEIDMGESLPVRCLVRALWLARAGETPFAVVVAPAVNHGEPSGVRLEIAVAGDEAGERISRDFLQTIERLVKESGSYRGKVLSLDVTNSYSGQVGSVRVHRLPAVRREEVILPDATLRLLESNVHGFIRQRRRLRELGLAVKKGLLFHGPPGTGKTHTIRYLASQLPDHTTLLITAEEVGALDEYFLLARFLQPAMIVIEDVDLIARSRETIAGTCAESTLNKLLNEMDGLREEAELLFVLTTNRPDQLEAALASRPGRIDQAIEFPLPDADGRRRLVHLYARGLHISDDVATAIVARTAGASPAFIKELMRRAAQFSLEAGADGTPGEAELSAALDEMLFAGGTLNRALLGGAADPSSDGD